MDGRTFFTIFRGWYFETSAGGAMQHKRFAVDITVNNIICRKDPQKNQNVFVLACL